jgi:tRNA A37 N6-isopentenylltransferase MiaA
MSMLFITYGPTHSGKTTFGNRLREALGESAKIIQVDNDVADEFVKANYNNLRTDPEVLARRTPSDPDLRLLIPQLVAGYALREGYSVIATAVHPKRVIRQSYYDIAQKHGARVVLLMFRVSDEEAAERIRKNARSTGILDVTAHGGTDFQELFENQKGIFEEPTEAEKASCYKAFDVTSDNCEEVLGLLKEMLQKASEVA